MTTPETAVVRDPLVVAAEKLGGRVVEVHDLPEALEGLEGPVELVVEAESPSSSPGHLRPLKDVLRDLREDETWRQWVRGLPTYKKDANGQSKKVGEVDYVPWYHAADFLDLVAPGWEVDVLRDWSLGGRLYLLVRLTVWGIGPAGRPASVSRTNVGSEELGDSGYGDPGSNAYAMAITRCVALFGGHRPLYHKDRKAKRERETATGGGGRGTPRGADPSVVKDPMAEANAAMTAATRKAPKKATPNGASGGPDDVVDVATYERLITSTSVDFRGLRHVLGSLKTKGAVEEYAKEVGHRIPDVNALAAAKAKLLQDCRDAYARAK